METLSLLWGPDINKMADKGSSGVVLYRKPLPPSSQYLKTSSTKTIKKTGNASLSNSKRREALDQDTDQGLPNLPYIHPLFPKGPPPLPMGKIIKHTEIPSPPPFPTPPLDTFTLTDFLLCNDTARGGTRRLVSSDSIVLSRDNYLKMTGWFAFNAPRQSVMHTRNIESKDTDTGIT